ncbi:N-acetylglucosamine-6-phosphate deacetylase [Radiobacillus sp. PE A8.2]|uniref:N-acetylglucosamine-6-phosphate deacetylase n=1 Tax=Radiobacillus sp. PE A8.2 TaxID=3380349 RepID=UPI00388FE4ED
MYNNNLILTNIQVYTDNGVIPDGYIKIEDGKITDVNDINHLTKSKDMDIVALPNKSKAIPGMIDIHIHGVNGSDVMDGTTESLLNMVSSLPQEGTTSFLATTITQDKELIEKALINASDFMLNHQLSGQSEIIGVHLEGPFLNKTKAGAQPLNHIIEPNLDLFKRWQALANDNIKLVTLAPEEPMATELIHYLKENGIIASVGHSDATLEEVDHAIKAGLSHVTHLFNQMSGLHHREPGVVGAALLRDHLMVEIITDGVHVRPEAVQLAYKQKTADKMILITDAMRAKCLKNGTYDLGGQQVTVEGGKALLENGTLAGSVLPMGQALKNVLTFTNCTLEEAISMTSVNPAKELDIYDRKGSLTIGKDADIVILDDDQEILMTFCRGKLAYLKRAF